MVEAIDFRRLLREERLAARAALQPPEEDVSPANLTTAQGERTPLPEEPVLHLSPKTHLSLGDHRVGFCPRVWYVPECYSAEEESSIAEAVRALPFTTLKTRRLQTHCSAERPLPSFLQRVVESVSEFAPFPLPVNHVLVNEYLPSQGILHHTDGPSYDPFVAIVSLLAPSVMTFRKRLSSSQIGVEEQEEVFCVLLQPRSVLIFSDEAYTHHLHGIDESSRHALDSSPCVNAHVVGGAQSGFIHRTDTRLSLTLRHKYLKHALGDME